MKILVLLFCSFFLLQSCSDGSTSPSNENNLESNPSELVSTEKIAIDPDKTRSPIELKKLFQRTKEFSVSFGAEYDKILFASLIEEQAYFYVIKGTWQDSFINSKESQIKKEAYKVGLVNSNNEIIIPLLFDKIYNLGATAPNLLEVESNGKIGLYDIHGNELAKPELDAVYPYKGTSDVWVQLRKGDQFGWLSKDGLINMEATSHSDKKLFQPPVLSELIANWDFHSDSKTLHPFIDLRSEYNEEEGGPIEGYGFYFLPSYLYQMGFVPEFQENWLFDGGDFGHESSIVNIERSEKVSGLNALVTVFDESFMDARGYHNKSENLVIVDDNMKPLDNLSIDVPWNIKACSNDIEFKIIDDLIELYKVEKSTYGAYDEMSTYRYYSIENNTRLKEQDILGDFKFTRALKITPDYFKGCFSRPITPEELASQDDEYLNFASMRHFSIEDLDVMRNEIFAAHGYKFKTLKWQQYFQEKTWYKPQLDNVDDKLSDIEKHNIQVILDIKKKMEGKEEEFIQKSYGAYMIAG